MKARRTLSRLAPILVVALWTSRAAAQESAAALALFEEGRALMQQKQYVQACAKFAESQRLSPASGTLLNLGDCNAKSGRTASAWAAFNDALTAAQAGGQTDREQYARKRITELEATLRRLTIKVEGPADVPGLIVRRDGVEVGRASWGAALPADPGPHIVEASAPGKASWKMTVQVVERTTEIAVPALGPDLGESAPPAPDAEPFFTQRKIGIGVGVLGIAAVAVGTVFGLQAISKNDEADPYCRTKDFCEQRGIDLVDDAKGKATLSTVFVISGAVAIAAGAILFFTGKTRSDDKQASRGNWSALSW